LTLLQVCALALLIGAGVYVAWVISKGEKDP
jgi:hypothetical protein